MVNYRSLLPTTRVDIVAMSFTFIMIPISYLHGVFYIAPTIWPVSNVPDDVRERNLFSYYVNVFLMTYLFLNTMANLLLTMTTDTSCRRVALPIVSQPGWYFCPFCQHYAPPRAHHCPTCKRCVLKRDHHCYFAGKCVGYYNQRYFVAFLMHITAASFYGATLSFIAVSRIMGGFSLTFFPALVFPVIAWLFQILPINPLVMVETSLSMFVFAGAGGLLALQIYEICRGQTYFDFAKNDNVYDLGVWKNVVDALGSNWWFCWISPLIPSPRLQDGTHYPPWDKAAHDHVTSHDHRSHSVGGKRKMVKTT